MRDGHCEDNTSLSQEACVTVTAKLCLTVTAVAHLNVTVAALVTVTVEGHGGCVREGHGCSVPQCNHLAGTWGGVEWHVTVTAAVRVTVTAE